MINLPSLLVWPGTINSLRQILDIHEESKMPCHGRTLKKTRCTRAASDASCIHVQVLLAKVVIKGGLDAARKYLQQLSELVLCKRNHQNQGAELLARWEKALTVTELRSASKLPELTEEKPTIDNSVKSTRTTIKRETRVKGENIDALFAKIEAETAVKSETKPVVRTRPITRSQTRRSQSTESQTVEPGEFAPPCPRFQPLKGSKTLRQRNIGMREYILRPLLDREKPGPGGIYIYKRPSTPTDHTPSYLKIGSTNNISRRMKQWQAKCHYEPQVLSDIRTDLYVKVERLVHKQLHNQRMRELHCAGCSGSHYEWFNTTQSVVEKTIDLWVRWSKDVPYDEAGMLKPEWVERLRCVDLDSEDCWDAFVDGVSEAGEDERA